MIVFFLAAGFEEVEALTPLDYLRRAGVPVKTVGVGGKIITGAHGIPVTADLSEAELRPEQVEGVILPGGMPGTKNLEASQTVQETLDRCAAAGLMIAAICAAPSVLGHKGLLAGKRATCFPGFEADCVGAVMTEGPAVTDGNIITARGAGCATSFAAAIITAIQGQAAARKVLQDVQWDHERHTCI